MTVKINKGRWREIIQWQIIRWKWNSDFSHFPPQNNVKTYGERDMFKSLLKIRYGKPDFKKFDEFIDYMIQ